MKKIWILFIVALWCVAGYQVIQGKSMIEEAKLIEVFHTVGTEEKTAVVEYNGACQESILQVGKRESFLKEVANKLGITDDIQIEYTEEAKRQEIVLTKEARYAHTTLKMITMEQETGISQFVTAYITLEKDMESVLACRKQLEATMEESNVNGRSSANVVGSYEGQLSLKERNQISDDILSNLGARVVTQNRDMDLYTIYGYTTFINEYEMQENCAVNVNIAMNYEESEDRTYVYMAVPVVGLEY